MLPKELTTPTRGNIAYMPLVSMALTLFGIAYYFANYIGHQAKTLLISLNAGSAPFYTNCYGGLSYKTDELGAYKRYVLDIEAGLWHQPKLQLAATDKLVDKNYGGGLLRLHNKFRINSVFH